MDQRVSSIRLAVAPCHGERKEQLNVALEAADLAKRIADQQDVTRPRKTRTEPRRTEAIDDGLATFRH